MLFRKRTFSFKDLINSDFGRFSIYNFICPMGPFHILFILYAHKLLGSYSLATSLFALYIVASMIMKVMLSKFKDKQDLKNILALGEFCFCGAYAIFALSSLMETGVIYFLVVGVLLFSLGASLWQGTYGCFIYECFEKDKPEVGSKPYSKARSIATIGASLGVIITTTLAGAISYGSAMLFGVVVNLFSGCMALTLKKVERCTCEDDDVCSCKIHIFGIDHFWTSFKHMLADRKLRYLSFAEASREGVGLTFLTFLKPFYISIMPVEFIGYVVTCRSFLLGASFAMCDRIIKKLSFIKTIKIFYLIVWALSIVAIGLGNMLSPAFIVIKSLFDAPLVTSIEYIMQKEYSQKERVSMSTILTIMSSLVNAPLIFLLGVIADKYSAQEALILLLPLYLIPFLLYQKAFRIIKE